MPEDPRNPELERRLNAWAASHPGNLQPELERRLHAALSGSLTPVRGLPSLRVLALAFFAVCVLLGAVLIAILKIAGVHFMTDSQTGWMIGIFAVAGFLFCLDLARRIIPGSRVRLPLLPVLALSGLAAIGALGLLFPWSESGAFVSEGRRCALMEATIAVPAAYIFGLLARRGVLFLSPGFGAALSGLAVSLALAPVQLQCMFPQAPHLLIWHIGTAAILIGSGALVANLRGKRPRG